MDKCECGGKLSAVIGLPSERRKVCYGCGMQYRMESWAEDCLDADETPITNADAEMHEPTMQTGCAGSR